MSRLMKWVTVVAVLAAGSAFAADRKIERLYKSKCSACHGMDGKGQTEKGKKMAVRDMASPEFQKGTDEEFKKAILEGFKAEKDGVKQEMDSFKEDLKGPDVDAMIKYMREFKK